MKILHVITLSEIGGAQSVVLNLVKESVKEGHTVMIASSPNGEMWTLLSPEVIQKPIKFLQRKINFVRDVQALIELNRIDKDFQPDVIHLHSSKTGLLGRLAFSSSKIVYTVHGFDSIRLKFRKLLFLEKLLKKSARYIVAVSQYDYNNLIKSGIKDNVRCIYNGLSDYHLESFNPLGNHESIFLSKFSGTDSFRVLCIARLAPQKRFDLFCKIAEELIDQNINFYWAGNKEQVLNLPKNVQCLGEIPNAHTLLRYVDLLVLPTDYEGMPICILEALCYSKPVIASDVGGIVEILNGKNGKAVPNVADNFSRQILLYKENVDMYRNASREARRSYDLRFTVNTMYQAYLKLYNTILEQAVDF